MNKQVSISKGNSKMGGVPSVSLPACTTCNPNAPCFKKCYARKLETFRPSVKEAYSRNFEMLIADRTTYWLQVRAAASMSRFFRFHVSGDIPDAIYLYDMVLTAKLLPHTTFLTFTKQYDIVNEYISNGGTLPENLKIIFSNWGEWKCKNPHGLPVAEVIFKGSEPRDSWKICGGNCTECACRGVGCWELKQGETIAFYEH
ncbi:MAG: hypothetical protein J6Q67_02450 [Clostridia bacterium]|nr:hypothetical protein [Clostridia bacterium]